MEETLRSLLRKKKFSSKDENFLKSQMDLIIKKYFDVHELPDGWEPAPRFFKNRPRRKKGF